MTDRDPRSKRYGYKSGFRRFWKPLSKIKNGSEKLGEELYVFEDLDTSDDEIDTEPCQVFELHNREDGARKVQQKSHNLQFVERPVMPGDTLRALALRYNVPVAVIKQVNNLLSEQDFYALTIIKIPVVTPQSYRLELLEEEEKQRNASRHIELPSTSNGIYESLPLESEIHLVSIGGALKSPDKNKEFFKRMDADLERIRLANNSRKSSLEQVTYSLTTKTFHPFNKEEKKNQFVRWF